LPAEDDAGERGPCASDADVPKDSSEPCGAEVTSLPESVSIPTSCAFGIFVQKYRGVTDAVGMNDFLACDVASTVHIELVSNVTDSVFNSATLNVHVASEVTLCGVNASICSSTCSAIVTSLNEPHTSALSNSSGPGKVSSITLTPALDVMKEPVIEDSVAVTCQSVATVVGNERRSARRLMRAVKLLRRCLRLVLQSTPSIATSKNFSRSDQVYSSDFPASAADVTVNDISVKQKRVAVASQPVVEKKRCTSKKNSHVFVVLSWSLSNSSPVSF
jgi:hypothetical protein